MSDTLLKWIAEELLGWRHHPSGPVFPSLEEWTHPNIFETLTLDQLTDYLQSWHGIGLVVEEMVNRANPQEFLRFEIQMDSDIHWWQLPFPEKVQHAFSAARKAVEQK